MHATVIFGCYRIYPNICIKRDDTTNDLFVLCEETPSIYHCISACYGYIGVEQKRIRYSENDSG